MTDLTEKQVLYRDYLIKKLGFKSDSFLGKYLEMLDIVAPKFKLLGAKISEKGEIVIPQKFSAVDLLQIEVEIKKNQKFKYRESYHNLITATDISNYTYCPVSFAISKTYEIEKLESTNHGTNEHEKKRLLDYLQPKETEEKVYEETDKVEIHSWFYEPNKAFFDDLLNSKIIYSGHSNEEKKKHFKNLNGKFAGQPDYIFQNSLTKKYFVVEEKFQYVPRHPHNINSFEEKKAIEKKRNSTTFYENHKNQLRSYIFGIDEYKLDYGYLVYWKYELVDGKTIILSCSVLKIKRDLENQQEINKVSTELLMRLRNKGGFFDIDSRKPEKCASCISSVLCGHKTGNYHNYDIPYSKNFIKTFYALFPEELKKYYYVLLEIGSSHFLIKKCLSIESAETIKTKLLQKLKEVPVSELETTIINTCKKYHISEQKKEFIGNPYKFMDYNIYIIKLYREIRLESFIELANEN